jgi:hypothetical protein
MTTYLIIAGIVLSLRALPAVIIAGGKVYVAIRALNLPPEKMAAVPKVMDKLNQRITVSDIKTSLLLRLMRIVRRER